jgi:hypothetical protein
VWWRGWARVWNNISYPRYGMARNRGWGGVGVMVRLVRQRRRHDRSMNDTEAGETQATTGNGHGDECVM